MDFIAVGYPSPLTAWGFQFVETALRRTFPSLAVLRLDLSDTVIDLAPHPGERLILSMFPSPAFAAAYEHSGSRSLVFADDPIQAVRYVRATHETGTYEALRSVSAGLALAAPFARSRLGAVVGRDLEGAPPDILQTLSEHLGLDMSDDAACAACADLGFETLSEKLFADTHDMPDIDEEERHAVVQALDGMRRHLTGQDPGEITWARQCFLSGDQPNSAAPIALDVTGRARILLYGPYLHLPRGRWTVRVLLGFSQDIRGMPFLFELYGTQLLGKARILAERGGIFEFEFEASVTAPHEPLELRIVNEQGAIEGHMGLVSIGFKGWNPLPDESDQLPGAAENAVPVGSSASAQ